MDGGLRPFERENPGAGSVSGGGQRASGTGGADGRHVGPTGGRGPDGQPRFDQIVPPTGYLWWYLDALSDDGQFGLTIIAFVGSVFSPYYAWARRGGAQPDPDHFCCLNVALYSRHARRWTMTERGAAHCHRDAQQFSIGPSQLRWDGDTLVIDIDEVGVPLPQRVRGQVRVHPQQLFPFSTPIDPQGLHRWGPLAPSARVEVKLTNPLQSWQGQGYLDSNEGDEPIDRSCREWDWSRSPLKDGSTAVIYDIQGQTPQGDKLLALRFTPQGEVLPFEAPARQPIPRTLWQIQRRMRSDGPVQVVEQLEDTPFYQRALLQSTLLGEQVQSFHESITMSRLVSPVVQAMLPFRMPRRG
jgi:carotenoid 1,2-hydratase